jgi:hypothetical protein
LRLFFLRGGKVFLLTRELNLTKEHFNARFQQLSQRWSKVVARMSSNGSGRPTSSLLEVNTTARNNQDSSEASELTSTLHQRPAGSTLTSI